MQGKIIGNYQITSLLAEGGMGAVYRGKHLTLPREVVIKVILPDERGARTQDLFEKRFRREAYVQSQLDHPNIVRVYDFFVEPPNYYLVMEFVQGMSLQSLVENRGLLPPPQALPIFKQTLAALHYAHTFRYVDEHNQPHTGLVHRDIKPANILLDGQARTKLTDFGIVKIGDEREMTRVGFQPGTVEYMSPEQIQGLDLDPRSDIYSMGVTLYEMLGGRLPFVRTKVDSDYEVRRGHVEMTPPPLLEINPSVPANLATIVNRALQKSPGERYQTAQYFLEAILAYESQAVTVDKLATYPVTSKAEAVATDEYKTAVATTDAAGNIPPAPVAPAQMASNGAGEKSRSGVPLMVMLTGCLLVLVAALLAWRYFTPSQSGQVMTPAPSATPAVVRAEVMKWSLQMNPVNGGAKLSGDAPLKAGESFQFHLTPQANGYLYIIAPGERNVPMTFLTTSPLPKTGVTSNRLEAGKEFQFPAGKDNWIGIDADTFSTPFTLIYSAVPLTAPVFLSAQAGKKLSLAEQQQLADFRQQHAEQIAQVKVEARGPESIVNAPAQNDGNGLYIFDVAIKRR